MVNLKFYYINVSVCSAVAKITNNRITTQSQQSVSYFSSFSLLRSIDKALQKKNNFNGSAHGSALLLWCTCATGENHACPHEFPRREDRINMPLMIVVVVCHHEHW